jgi:hypothetical protein
MEMTEENFETNITIKDEQKTINNNEKSTSTFNHLLEIQNLVKKESALKELCKKELFNLIN